ncbi:MAG: anaerobic ribonucleoside-triphosphate reductase activating protein [Planctomycetes bacterium]|nr:anaerobic ribonucleoside-triphosphate reductase activating protein [Planctomycetota bacterium]
MQIKGLVKTSIVDFPGKVATVVFTGGCNFRCPYCHNVDLVLRPESLPDIAVGEVLRLLAERQGFVDGVVITGGEPTLQSDLADFARELKSLGLAVKLDTNGYRPRSIQLLLREGLLDYVAMDVKGALEKYSLVAGCRIEISRIENSIQLILSSEIEYEFRTTAVPGMVTVKDVETIAQSIAGARRYLIQQFRSSSSTLAPQIAKIDPYPVTVLEEMADAARRWVPDVSVREI